MIARQPYQVILPLHLRAKVVLQASSHTWRPHAAKRCLDHSWSSPMRHEGLITQPHGQEWVFDSAAALSATPSFSVTSSTRSPLRSPAIAIAVTLTYILYSDDNDGRGPTPAGGLTSNSRRWRQINKVSTALSWRSSRIRSFSWMSYARRHVYQVEGGRGLEHVYGLLEDSGPVAQPCIKPSVRLGSSLAVPVLRVGLESVRRQNIYTLLQDYYCSDTTHCTAYSTVQTSRAIFPIPGLFETIHPHFRPPFSCLSSFNCAAVGDVNLSPTLPMRTNKAYISIHQARRCLIPVCS